MFDTYEDLLQQIEVCSEKIKVLPEGSKERQSEIENYCKMLDMKLKMESSDDTHQLELKKEAHVDADRKKGFWLNLGKVAGTLGLTGLGTYLTWKAGKKTLIYNIEQGGLSGKDAQAYFKDLGKKEPKF